MDNGWAEEGGEAIREAGFVLGVPEGVFGAGIGGG